MKSHLYTDNSKMVGSFIAVLSGHWATYAIAILTTAFITRSLGPDDYAKFIQLQFLLGIFTTIGLSISSGVTRYVAEYAAKGEMRLASGVLKTSFKVTAIIGVSISIIMILFAKPLASVFIGDSNTAGCIEILAIAAGLTEAISPFYAYIYGRQKFSMYALLSALSFAFMRSGVVLALQLGAGLYGLSLAWLIASILTSFTIVIPVLRMAGRGETFNLSQLLSYSMPLIASVYLAYLLQWADSILVPYAGSMSLLAMTSIAMSLVSVSLVLLNSISTVLFTHLVEIDVTQGREALVNAGYNLSKLLFYCFIPFGFFVGSISNLLIFLYAGEAFSQASLMLKLLSPLMTANAVIFIIWYNEVIAIGKTRLLLLNTIASLTAYLVIGFLLVPLLGVVGYILTKVLYGTIIFPYILSKTKKSLVIKFDFMALIISSLVSIVIISPSILMGILTSDYLLTTSISIIGLVCYAFVIIKFNLLTKDEVRIILKVIMRSFRLERQMISVVNLITKSQGSESRQLENRAFSKYTTSYEIGPINEGSFMPFVSVIIPTSNNKQFVIHCLDSLAKVDYQNLEIIVVDNASSDGTSNLLSKKFPYVRIIRSDVNLGYAGGINLGIGNAKGTYLILLNDDTIVDPHFIFRLVEAMEAEPMAAIGSCKIYMMDGNALQYAGGFIDGMGYPLMRGCGEEDKGQYDWLVEVEWASGACMIIRRKYLDHIGLLDDAYYSYYEDTDLSLRAHENGYKVIYIPRAVIRHYGSATTRRHRRYQVFSVRNRFRFLLKHYECKRFAKAIAWDFFHTPARKVPYLLIALIWSYPSLLSAMFKNPYKKLYSFISVGCICYILYYWRVCTKVFLSSLIGRTRLHKLLIYHNRLNILFHPFFIVRVQDNIVQTKVGNNILLQPLDNLYLNEEIDFQQVYDRFYDINKDDVIIDIGAHVGVFTIREARKVERGFVLAIEPHPFNYLLLTNNIKANKLTNVQALSLALWSSNGSRKLYLGSSSGNHSLKYYLKERDKYIEVKTRTLDTIVKELGIKRVNFIKIDVEGAELEVLRGARETLKRNGPVISIAAYHTPTEIQEVTKYLQENGYQVLIYESEYIYGFKSKGEVVIENITRQ